MVDRTRIHIAPMMGWTDAHGRALMGLLSPSVRLWSDMKTADAVIYGEGILDGADPAVVLQLGGCDPLKLAAAARKGVAAGFGAINLNMGCPSSRVGSGGFGAAMMLDLEGAQRCAAALVEAVPVPVSVKCRLGVDEQDPQEVLPALIEKLAGVGVETFALHARKAWLKGLSPRQNRSVPPLDYTLAYGMKKEYPHLHFIINGGIKTLAEAETHLTHTDGVMIGREAFRNPYMLAQLEVAPHTRQEILERWTAYAIEQGLTKHHLTHYLSGLWTAQRGAARFRRALNDLPKLDEKHAPQILSWAQGQEQAA